MTKQKKKSAPKKPAQPKKKLEVKKWLVWGFFLVLGSVLLTENAPVFIVSTIFGWHLHKRYEIQKKV